LVCSKCIENNEEVKFFWWCWTEETFQSLYKY
jgi:hypothetical protein